MSKIDFTEDRFQKPNIASETIERNPFVIRDIKKYSESGEWVIPIFQRFFDWTKDDVKDLWNSIFRGYYIGALLLWEAKGDPDITTEPIKGVDIDQDHASRNYVILDDDPDMLYEQRKNFIHVNAKVGLSLKNVEKAIKLLNE